MFYCPPTWFTRALFVFILETINCEIAKRKSATSEPNNVIDDSWRYRSHSATGSDHRLIFLLELENLFFPSFPRKFFIEIFYTNFSSCSTAYFNLNVFPSLVSAIPPNVGREIEKNSFNMFLAHLIGFSLLPGDEKSQRVRNRFWLRFLNFVSCCEENVNNEKGIRCCFAFLQPWPRQKPASELVVVKLKQTESSQRQKTIFMGFLLSWEHRHVDGSNLHGIFDYWIGDWTRRCLNFFLGRRKERKFEYGNIFE